MQIQMLREWNGFDDGGVYTVADAEGTRLIGLGLARLFTGAELSPSSDLTAVNAAIAGLQDAVPDATAVVHSVSGVDISAQVSAKIAALKALGGGVLKITGDSPATMSQQMLITGDNIRVHLDVDISYTGTQIPTTAAAGVICFKGTPSAYLKGAALTAPKLVKIDCNGRNMSGYTYSTATQYAGVYFLMCESPVARNIYAYNSIHYGIQMSYSPGCLIDHCRASHTLYDNGIQIVANAEHIRPYSDTDPATWNNGRIINPVCWNNLNHAVGTWGSVGLTIENPICWDNGNNTGSGPVGPAGGINFEYDQTSDPTAARDYRGMVINPRVHGSWGLGMRVNCKGVQVVGGVIQNTKKPTAYTDTSNPGVWGSSVFVQNAGTLEMRGTVIDGSNLYGLRAQGNATQFPILRFDGEIKGCQERAVYAIGAAVIDIAPSSYIHDCATTDQAAAGARAIELNNAPLNTNGGTFRIGGRYDANGGQVMTAAAVGEVDISGIRGHNNCANLASAFHALYVISCQRLKAADIMLSSTNAKQSRVLKCDSAVQAVIDRNSILGDQTNTTAPRADVVATTLVGDLILTAAPATAPSYLGQQAIDTTNGKVYTAKGQASAADWLLLN